MLKILYWLLFDAFFIFAFVKLRGELGEYIILFIVLITFFTWELIRAIKAWLK